MINFIVVFSIIVGPFMLWITYLLFLSTKKEPNTFIPWYEVDKLNEWSEERLNKLITICKNILRDRILVEIEMKEEEEIKRRNKLRRRRRND
jgi:hypothetical protein